MKYCVGIDLGSTTTKAVILGERAEVLGQGITNSRSNYKVACEVALAEGMVSARFELIGAALASTDPTSTDPTSTDPTSTDPAAPDAESPAMDAAERQRWLRELERAFRLEQYLDQLGALEATIYQQLDAAKSPADLAAAVRTVLTRMRDEAPSLFEPGGERKSDFFRDIAGGLYQQFAEQVAAEAGIGFDPLVAHYDRAILVVENRPVRSDNFLVHARAAFGRLPDAPAALGEALESAGALVLDQAMSVGTGYGRQTLPFPREQIRSEILCHGLGANTLFPGTRTVLDIGGQDTKAIQVDENGIVTSFQMNDRCAAGCGRYLGYIADEMNLGVHELGPLAQLSRRRVKINSTCTVFAGAELRERLSLGEKREDIVAGLHRAVILRAMSLLARSGGIEDEFTFTGGVAKNPAAVDALGILIEENYGHRTFNISPDSIYTGALGAAIFAHRDWQNAN